MGNENIFIFGMTVDEVDKLRSDGYGIREGGGREGKGGSRRDGGGGGGGGGGGAGGGGGLIIMSVWCSRYVSRKYYESNPELKKAIDQIHSGVFSPEQPELFHDLTYQLLNYDR